MILQRGEQRPRQGPSLRLKTSLRGKPGEAQRRETSGRKPECRTTAGLTSYRLESDLKGTLEHDDLPGWGQRPRCGLRHRLWTSNRWKPGRANRRGRRPGTHNAHNGLISPSEARSDGASDHDDNADQTDLVEAYAVGAHTPVGTRKAHGAGDGPDADHGPGHGARDPDAQRHPVPYASDDTRGAPNGGAFEREQPLLQGQPPPTPYAPGDDIRANVAIGGRALDTRKPPALAGTHKHRARRGSASPPLRTAEDEADAEGRVPSDTAGQYVDFDGASHGPEGRADHTELARARAEVERLRKALEMYRDRERVPSPRGPRLRLQPQGQNAQGD